METRAVQNRHDALTAPLPEPRLAFAIEPKPNPRLTGTLPEPV